jgi:hypothetical protein
MEKVVTYYLDRKGRVFLLFTWNGKALEASCLHPHIEISVNNTLIKITLFMLFVVFNDFTFDIVVCILCQRNRYQD